MKPYYLCPNLAHYVRNQFRATGHRNPCPELLWERWAIIPFYLRWGFRQEVAFSINIELSSDSTAEELIYDFTWGEDHRPGWVEIRFKGERYSITVMAVTDEWVCERLQRGFASAMW